MSDNLRIEIVTYRDPDGPTQLAAYVAGRPATVEWVDVDPSSGHALADWRDDALVAIGGCSDAAATAIAEAYRRGEATDCVT